MRIPLMIFVLLFIPLTAAAQGSAVGYLENAERQFNERKYDLALKSVNEAIRLQPDYPPAFLLRGKVYFELRDYFSASNDFTVVIDSKPDFVDGYIERGKTHIQLGNYYSAIDDLTKAIELEPDNEDAFFHRGRAHYLSKKYKESISDGTRTIELAPGYVNAYNNRAENYSALKDYQSALKDYTTALEIAPADTFALYGRGWTLATQLGKYQEALIDLSRFIEQRPRNAGAYGTRAFCYMYLENDEAAIRDYALAMECEPANVLWYNSHGHLCLGAGYLKDARETYLKILQMYSNAWDAELGLAVISMEENDSSGARMHYDKAVSHKPALGKGMAGFDELNGAVKGMRPLPEKYLVKYRRLFDRMK